MRVPQRVLRYEREIKALGRAKAGRRKTMLRDATDGLILALVDAAKMIIRGEVTMSARHLSNVRRQRGNFERIVKPSTGIANKRRIAQTGGFIGALLGPLLKIGAPIIQGLLGGLGGGRR